MTTSNRRVNLHPMHTALDDTLNHLFGNVFDQSKTVNKYPLTDVYFNNGNAHLEIAVAGFSKEDISVELNGNILRIVGKAAKDDVQEREYVSRSIARRDFDVSYKLLTTVDSVKASVHDGILKICIVTTTKTPEAKKIQID